MKTDKSSSCITKVNHKNGGFAALIAVILLASGSMVYAVSTLASAVLYADQVNNHELRIQAQLNANACLDKVKLMKASDYFLKGIVIVPEFGCVATITDISPSKYAIDVRATMSGVSRYDRGGN